MDSINKKFEEVLDMPAMSPVKEKYHTFLALPQKQKAKMSVVASILSFFFFFIILIVLRGTTVKNVTGPKASVVIFMETTPEDLLAMRYLMLRPDYNIAAIVVSGSGVAASLKPASENLEKFLSLMASEEGNKAAANVPVYYGTSFSTTASQRISSAATSASLPSTPLTASANYLNNLTTVIGAPNDAKSCSMSTRFVEDDVLYRADTLFGSRMYLPRRREGVRGYVDRTDTFNYAGNEKEIADKVRRFGLSPTATEPFFIPLARDVLLPLQQASIPIRAIVLGPLTDLVTLLRRAYKPNPQTSPMPQFTRLPRIFSDIVVSGGAFGTSAVGDIDLYASTTIGASGPVNIHAQQNFFYDAPSAHTLIEGGTEFNDKFAADMAPVMTLVTTNAAISAGFTQAKWNTLVDARANALTAAKPSSIGVAMKGLSNVRRIASTMPPMYKFDLSAPLDLLTAVVFTDPSLVIKTSVVDRVHVNDGNQISSEGVTGKSLRTTSPLRTVVLGAVASNFWAIAETFLLNMPNPKDV